MVYFYEMIHGVGGRDRDAALTLFIKEHSNGLQHLTLFNSPHPPQASLGFYGGRYCGSEPTGIGLPKGSKRADRAGGSRTNHEGE